jgi:Cytochrome c554 and c-prime
MRLLKFSVLSLALCLFVMSSPAENKYTGVKFCAACHKGGKGGDAYTVWSKTGHANAYQVLLNDASKKIAKEKGLKVAPNEAPECLKCHVTGGGVAKNVDKTFSMEEGVTCEACHGAASAYKIIHSKGDMAKSKAAGLMVDIKNEKFCTQCHNSESPTFKGFKLDEMWKKIEHGKKGK